jgi:preprotein translocase subunit Sec63
MTQKKKYEVVFFREFPEYVALKNHAWLLIRWIDSKEFSSYTLKGGKCRIVGGYSTKRLATQKCREFNKLVEKKLEPGVLPDLQETPVEESFQYRLTLTENQAQTIVKALDLYAHIGMGQLGEVSRILRDNRGTKDIDTFCGVSSLIEEAASLWTGGKGYYYGISSEKVNDTFRVAWDLQQVIRHQLTWDRHPEGGFQVYFDKPKKTSIKEPLAHFYNLNQIKEGD